MVRVNTSGYPYAVFYSVKWVNLLIIKILIFFESPRFYEFVDRMKAGENNKSLLRRFTVTNFYALYLFLPSVQFLRIESFFLKELEGFLELQVIGCITNKSLKLSGFSLPG